MIDLKESAAERAEYNDGELAGDVSYDAARDLLDAVLTAMSVAAVVTCLVAVYRLLLT